MEQQDTFDVLAMQANNALRNWDGKSEPPLIKVASEHHSPNQEVEFFDGCWGKYLGELLFSQYVYGIPAQQIVRTSLEQ